MATLTKVPTATFRTAGWFKRILRVEYSLLLRLVALNASMSGRQGFTQSIVSRTSEHVSRRRAAMPATTRKSCERCDQPKEAVRGEVLPLVSDGPTAIDRKAQLIQRDRQTPAEGARA